MGQSLNEQMQIGHLVRVHGDGTVTDAPREVYGPEGARVYGEGEEPRLEREGWNLMRGYSGQHGYTGPVMHSSELVSGGLEEDIKDHPGLYVALPVEYDRVGQFECCDCGAEAGDWCKQTCAEGEPRTYTEGWVVAFQEYPAWRFSPGELVNRPDLGETNLFGWNLKLEREHLKVFLDLRGQSISYAVKIGNDWHPADDVDGVLRPRLLHFTGGADVDRPRTWADGFGNWHALVKVDFSDPEWRRDSEAEAAKAVRNELEQRAPEGAQIRVSLGVHEVYKEDGTVEYIECD